jgi:hypothetical protein
MVNRLTQPMADFADRELLAPTSVLIVALLACGSRTELSNPGSRAEPAEVPSIGEDCTVAVEGPSVCAVGELTIETEVALVALRTDATKIVYTTASGNTGDTYARMEAVSLAGGKPHTLYRYRSPANQFAWTLRGGFVYLSDGQGNILRVPVRGGSPSALGVLPPSSWVSYFDADERFLYFGGRDNRAGTEKLFRLPLSGGDPERIAQIDFTWEYVIDYTPNTAVEVAADGCSLYFLHQPTVPRNGGSNEDGTVYRIPKQGGEPAAVISGLTNPEHLSLTHQAIWVLDRGKDPFDHKDDRLVGVGKDGSPREPILFIERSTSHHVVDFGRNEDALHYVLWGPRNDLNARSGWWTQSLDRPGEASLIDGLAVHEKLFAATIDRHCGHLYSAAGGSILRQPLP